MWRGSRTPVTARKQIAGDLYDPQHCVARQVDDGNVIAMIGWIFTASCV
jgi:hypothetical protein